MVKERPYENWTTSRLKKHSGLIKRELDIRAFEEGGQDGETFRDLHSQPECNIITEHVRTQRSGWKHIGISPVDDYEAPEYVFKYKCEAHNVESRIFTSMTWVEKDEHSLEVEYPKLIKLVKKMREEFGESAIFSDYWTYVERRVINAGLVMPEESIFHKP